MRYYRSICLIKYREGHHKDDHIEVGDVISQEDVDRYDFRDLLARGYLVPVEGPVNKVRALPAPKPRDVRARDAKRHWSDALLEDA